MASTYVNDLRLNEMATGDQSGAWGTVTNLNLEMIAEAFAYGTEAIANASTHTITVPDGAKGDERRFYLKCTGGGQACTVTLAPNTVSKVWMIENATSYTLTFTQGSGANVAVLAGQVKMIATDGAGSGAVIYDLLTDVNLAGTTVTDIITANQATVDDIDLNGKVITMTGSSGDTATLTVAADGALAIATTDAAAAAANISITADGTFTAVGTTITLDSAGDIVLDADGADVIFKDGGTSIGQFTNSSSDFVIQANVQDKDILFKGDDGGAGITALTLDMSAAGAAAFNSSITSGGAAVKVAGKESIYVPAAAMYPSTTNPCSDLTQVETTALRPDLKVLDFADGADDFAQFTIAFPKSWNEGTVTFQPFWTVTGTNTGTVAWQLAAVAITNDESINTAFGTQVATTALAFSGTSNDLMVSAESGAVTIAGSPAANDMCFFQINRDISADTQSGAARLIGIKILFTTDAANDA
jgi:hypothetical protein